MRAGKVVYQEAQSFERKQVAQGWLKRRESELAEPGAIERANHKGATVTQMIDRYLIEYENLRPLGKTKRATLTAAGKTWLGSIPDIKLSSQNLVEYGQWGMDNDGGSVQA